MATPWKVLTIPAVSKLAGGGVLFIILKPGGKSVSGQLDSIGRDHVVLRNGRWTHEILIDSMTRFTTIKLPAVTDVRVGEKQLL